MNYILFDDASANQLAPLTFTRPVAEIRTGILTIREKWEIHLQQKVSFKTQPHLQAKFPLLTADESIFINSSVCPNTKLLLQIKLLRANEILYSGDILIATRIEGKNSIEFDYKNPSGNRIEFEGDFIKINFPEDIFYLNDKTLAEDFELLTAGRKSATIPTNNTLIGDKIFVEDGAVINCAILNSSTGPIYIGKDAEVMEGAMIRGPFSLGEHSQVKMGAKIYGATTIGPYCKVGGEVSNSVIFGYSNKGHEGFLGNSVLGEWCNIGANSDTSNLKNNYDQVRLWSYEKQTFRKTGLQFCGLIMADHAKCGINTMFNTGTVIGVSANVFGSGYPRNFIPDFAWGGASGFEVYQLNKCFETAERVFARRSKEFDDDEKAILEEVFAMTSTYRNF